jgi:hypothetical protein
LPEYFGFEAAGILLRDVKNDLMFTVNELTKDESEKIFREKFRERERKER